MSKLISNINRSFIAVTILVALSSNTFGLEFHPGHDKDNPPPKGYWMSNMASSYNPWLGDMKTGEDQFTLLEFPASNRGVTSYKNIKMLPEGHTFEYGYHGPTLKDGGTWEFVDLSTKTFSGTNWVHGNHYTYPKNSWAIQFNGEGDFTAYRPGGEYAFDLNAYRGIAIEVSNVGDTYLIVNSPVQPSNKGMRQWLGKKHRAYIGLEPGETDVLYFPFIRDQNKVSQDVLDYFKYIHHLCGYPGGHLYGQVYSQIDNVKGAWGIRAMVPEGVKKGDVKWTINRMWAGGKYHVPSLAEIRAEGHTEAKYNDKDWVDAYGQWKYDNWVGKVWNEADAKKKHEHLKEYLASNPEPAEWSKYGGWKKEAYRRTAKGWFRVEKYNDKWWFVDPEGYLFLSQGALHMSANTPKASAQAGYTDATHPDEIYFPRLRSMGLNSVGGNSSWKWHKGKMPYTYQIKTGLAPIDANDIIDAGGTEAFTELIYKKVSAAKSYIKDPYCIGVIVDNELKIKNESYEDATLGLEPVSKIYFRAVRLALDKLAEEVGRPGRKAPNFPTEDYDYSRDANGTLNQLVPEESPIVMIDPASSGGEWMGYFCDVMAQHRMEGFTPNFHKTNWKKPIGQFTFTMGNLDVGLAHFGLTMFLNQRNRAQGMANYMRLAYKGSQNIACHIYSYGKWDARPLTEFRMITTKSNSTDYWLMKYLNKMGTDMYYLHMGLDVPDSLAPDNDNDGIPDREDDDDDNDGIKDKDEREYGLNPYVAADADEDLDGDGISNKDEINVGANPYGEKYILKVENSTSSAYEQMQQHSVTLGNDTKVTAKITNDEMLELSLEKEGKTTTVKITQVGSVLQIAKNGVATLTLTTSKKIAFTFQNGGEVSTDFSGVVLPLSSLPLGTKIAIDGDKIRSTVTLQDKLQF